MLGRVSETSRYGNGLGKRDVPAPVKLSRFSNLAAHYEVRFLEVLGINRDLRVLKDFGVGRLNGLREFRKSLSCGRQISDIAQSDVAVRLDGDRLIKFRRQQESQFQRVARIDPVPPISFVKPAPVSLGVVCGALSLLSDCPPLNRLGTKLFCPAAGSAAENMIKVKVRIFRFRTPNVHFLFSPQTFSGLKLGEIPVLASMIHLGKWLN